jgi:HSP20 family molecular chaperone IbpA
MSGKELELREKKELQAKGEATFSCKVYQPDVDILETEKEFVLFSDMPGVKKEDIDITLENNTLRLRGMIRPQEYESLKPLYVEYNLGHYEREFHLSEAVDQDNIEASMKDGVLGLKIRKAEKAQPKKITVN